MNDPRTSTEEIQLLEQRIDESGLKTGPFARDVLIREPRTVRRWLTGESPIPNRVKEWLQDPQVAPWPASDEIPHGQVIRTSTETLRDRMQDTGICDICGASGL